MIWHTAWPIHLANESLIYIKSGITAKQVSAYGGLIEHLADFTQLARPVQYAPSRIDDVDERRRRPHGKVDHGVVAHVFKTFFAIALDQNFALALDWT